MNEIRNKREESSYIFTSRLWYSNVNYENCVVRLCQRSSRFLWVHVSRYFYSSSLDILFLLQSPFLYWKQLKNVHHPTSRAGVVSRVTPEMSLAANPETKRIPLCPIIFVIRSLFYYFYQLQLCSIISTIFTSYNIQKLGKFNNQSHSMYRILRNRFHDKI